MKQGLIFILSGPSGSGKTTLVSRLFKEAGLKNKLARSISLTTRQKRTGEKDKKDYFFVSEDEFQTRLKAKKILEWTKYAGYYYATPKDYLEKQLERGKNVVLCLDVKGALAVQRLYPKKVVMIFIMPPALKELKKRITQRCQKAHQGETKLRLGLARREVRQAAKYNYCLVNKDLVKTVSDLKEIILANFKEKVRRRGSYGLCSDRAIVR